MVLGGCRSFLLLVTTDLGRVMQKGSRRHILSISSLKRFNAHFIL